MEQSTQSSQAAARSPAHADKCVKDFLLRPAQSKDYPTRCNSRAQSKCQRLNRPSRERVQTRKVATECESSAAHSRSTMQESRASQNSRRRLKYDSHSPSREG